MHTSLTLPVGTLYGFLLVLARVSGALVFVPLPGIREGPQIARTILALAFTMALYPRWPSVAAADAGIGRMTAWMLAEAGLGIAVGLAVSFVTEAFRMTAQVIGMQAGYGYASMIDPQTQADSSVLVVFAQLAAGLLFFALGLDGEILRIFAASLETQPPGHFHVSLASAASLLRFGASMFSVGLRLAMPVIALLVLVDLALALLGRLNAHLQLLSMAFPAKMTAALLLLAWMTAVFPRMFRNHAGSMLVVLRQALQAAPGAF
jgi:flagellar biosynthetic protein FliR